MEQIQIRKLEEGQIYVEYGPVAMLLMAFTNGVPRTALCYAAVETIHSSLEQIAAALPVLRCRPAEIHPGNLTGVPLEMYRAVVRTGEATLTPMAAVAGSVADVVADFLQAEGATVAVANNGGDIALRLAPGEQLRLRTVTALRTGETTTPVVIHSEDGIGGICTSGLGGRSFTRGVMDSLSVFSPRASWADALATHLANCSFLESDRVATTLAKNLAPGTDIPELTVVTAVDSLTAEEKRRAVAQVLQEAERQRKRGDLLGISGYIQGFHFAFDNTARHWKLSG